MGRAGPHVRVLHVDDDERYAGTVADRLGEKGDLSVATATRAVDAIERIEQERFDCVLTDYRLPDADGVELLRRVRDQHPDLPVILLTGRGSEAVASEAISAGVTDYFVKDAREGQFALLANRIETAVEGFRAERALRDQQDRDDEFVRLVAHDLRNPMAVAKGWLAVEEEDRSDVARRKAIAALDRMDDIVDNLETLARSGEAEADDECVELSSVATAAWELVDPDRANLHVEYGPKLAADPGMLQQALENLFENAEEHGGDGVTVRVGATEDGFFVEDDGAGVDPSDREMLFESGYTADGGTGLGLAIVDRIADAHGWSVIVTDADDGGARFEFSNVDLSHSDRRS